MSKKLNDLDAIFSRITGKTLVDIADDVLSGKPQEQIAREVSEHVRQEHDKSDTLKNALREHRGQDEQ